MMRTSYFALALFVLACSLVLPSVADSPTSISSSGIVNYPKMSNPSAPPEMPSEDETNLTGKMLRQTFQKGSWSASKLASIIDVYQGHYDALDKIGEIKAIRPDVLGIVYYNTYLVWTAGHVEYEAQKLAYFINHNWILKDRDGAYIRKYEGDAYMVDVGNPDFQLWLANWCRDQIAGKRSGAYTCYEIHGGGRDFVLDGTLLDNWFAEAENFCYDLAQTPINPRTGSPWTNRDVLNAYKSLTLKIRQVLDTYFGAGKIILVNGVYRGARYYSFQSYYTDAILNGGIDGIESEGWISTYDASNWVSEDWWKSSIDFAVWMENNFPAAGGKYFMPIHMDNSFLYTNNMPSDMSEAQYQQYVTYGYASRLLTIQQLDTIMPFGYYSERTHPQSLFKINIGDPAENYHILGSSHVYTRKFTGGMVLVNPTSSSYTVAIGSGYKNAVSGSSVPSTLTLQPHTGLILAKV